VCSGRDGVVCSLKAGLLSSEMLWKDAYGNYVFTKIPPPNAYGRGLSKRGGFPTNISWPFSGTGCNCL
jgi:hypothetical protein